MKYFPNNPTLDELTSPDSEIVFMADLVTGVVGHGVGA